MKSEQEILRDWIRHPGTILIAHKMRHAAKMILKQYDTCDADKLLRLQLTRQVLINTIPQLIEGIINKSTPPEKKWNWRSMLRL